MTGYGVAEKTSEHLRVKVEIKSLNGKFLELNLRCPKILSSKELEIRNRFAKKLERGTIQFYINLYFQDGSHQAVNVNEDLALEYFNKLKGLAGTLNAGTQDVFRWIMDIPEILQVEEEDLRDEEVQLILDTCDEAFESLNNFRIQEGTGIKELLHEHCAAIAQKLPEIEQHESERTELLKNRLQNSLKEMGKDENFDSNRFEQELIYYLEKFDISEEKNRLIAHCEHFEETLNGPGKGKKLGFIAQEMGREINTLGSKANHAGIQRSVIAMKEELEKIKEQVLNVV
jgi:uncharacterized protein (TIGR00255 family)